MHLVADLLDEQLIDIRGENAGKVDGIVLELRDGQPPKVAYIEVSPITLLRRFSMRLARWYARLDAKLGPERGTPYRIPVTRLVREADSPALHLDFDAEHTPIFALEDWLRRTIVERIPGGKKGGEK